VARLSEEASRPVLTNLQTRFTGSAGTEFYPRELSHLYLDRPLILIGRLPVTEKELAFQIEGRSRRGSHDLLYRVDLTVAPDGGEVLRTEWAWQALLESLAALLARPDAESRARVSALISRYRLELPEAYRRLLDNQEGRQP
jgi:hypothetical protein